MKDECETVFEFLKPLIRHMGKALSPFCEIVLHDLRNPENSIIAIENGQVTGRSVGDGLDELGFRLLRKGVPGELVNYRGSTRDGKTLRSSSFFLRNAEGEAFGAIGLNIDITPLLILKRFATEMTDIQEHSVQETFEKNVNEVLENYIEDAFRLVGKEVPFMEREDKLKFLEHMEQRGAFLIRYSVDRVAAILGISRYTLYQYLEEVRQDSRSAALPSE